MRFILPLLFLLPSLSYAQTTDWKSLGKSLADDSKPMMDRYVYMNADATDKNIPTEKPVLSQNDVHEWLSLHLAQVLTLSGKNYDRQVYQNRLVFTPKGYGDYIVYLRNAHFEKFLKDNQYKLVSFVDGTPEILSEGLQTDEGKPPYYRWQAKAILVLSYLDYRNNPPAALFKETDPRKINNRLPIQANIELVRIPVQENGTVVAINSLTFTEPEKP